MFNIQTNAHKVTIGIPKNESRTSIKKGISMKAIVIVSRNTTVAVTRTLQLTGVPNPFFLILEAEISVNLYLLVLLLVELFYT